MDFGSNSLFLFKNSANNIKLANEIKDKNVVVILPYEWMSFEAMYYLKDAQNIQAITSTNIKNIKDQTLAYNVKTCIAGDFFERVYRRKSITDC